MQKDKGEDEDKDFFSPTQAEIERAWRAIKAADAALADYFLMQSHDALKRGDYKTYDKYNKLYTDHMVDRVIGEFSRMDLKITPEQIRWAKEQQVRMLLAGLEIDETLFRAIPQSQRAEIREYVMKNWEDSDEREHLIERLDAQVLDEVKSELFGKTTNQDGSN